MYCKECGQELMQGQQFCPGCGASVPGQTDSALPPGPARPPMVTAEPAASLSAKKNARVSNYLAIPGFILFIAGLVLLGAAYVKQTPQTGMPGWGIIGFICLLVGIPLLIAALVFSILHWGDKARAYAQKQAAQAPPFAGPGAAAAAPAPLVEPAVGTPVTERPGVRSGLFCTGCGQKLEPGEHFCAGCGAKVPG